MWLGSKNEAWRSWEQLTVRAWMLLLTDIELVTFANLWVCDLWVCGHEHPGGTSKFE